MTIALIVVAALLFVAVVLLANAFGSVATENSIRAKLSAFDAAEAGIDQVIDVLDKDRGRSTDCTNGLPGVTMGRLADGGFYQWCVAYNSNVKGKGFAQDHANLNHKIFVPENTVYAWSSGIGTDGGRGVLIEALIAPSTGMPLPTGAVDAGGNVYARGDVGIYESGPGAANGTIHANGSIYQSAAPRTVQGGTYAGGVDQVTGKGGTFPNSPLMTFPLQSQVDAAAQDANGEASGTTPMMPPPTRSTVIEGNAFINGGVDLYGGTVIFEHGQSVYINGNLCIHSGARVLNEGANIWVAGVVSSVGASGGYVVDKILGGTLIALGLDSSPPCSNSSGSYAVQLDATSSHAIGFAYAPNGSIDLAGPAIFDGAIDAGNDIYLDSTNGGGLRFDPAAALRVPTYDFKVVSYMEY